MGTVTPNRLIFDARLKAEKDYWVGKLSRELGASGLRADFETTADWSGTRDAVSLTLPAGLSRRLSDHAGGSPIALYAALMTALKVYLYRANGANPVVVGSPSLRDGAVSRTPNVLPIVDDIDGRRSFRDCVSDVGATLDEAYANQDYPFDRLLMDLALDGPGGVRPLFDVALRLANLHDELPEVGNGVTVTFEQLPGAMTCEVKYRNELFRRESAERFARRLVNLLDAATGSPDAPVGRLEFLTADERERLLFELNQTRADAPPDRAVHQLFSDRAARAPDATALVCDDQHVSYRELDGRSNRLARHLRALGVAPESRVAVYAERTPEMIVALLGVLKAGAAYLPLDATCPSERLAFMLEDSRAEVVLTQRPLLGRLPECAARVFLLDEEWAEVNRRASSGPEPRAEPSNLAYVIYTSGSTGRPKGVMVEHRGVTNLVHAQVRAFVVSEGSRVLQFASFGFDASVSEIFMALCSGAVLHLGRRDEGHRGTDVAEVLRREAITTVTLPPALLAVLGADELPALESVVTAGEACPPEVARRWRPGRRFFNAYGPTETSVCASWAECTRDYERSVPIGRPLANTRLYVLDAGGQLAPEGDEGELYVGGVGVARGYLHRPALTAEKFTPDPFGGEPGARLYRTGDVVRYAPGGELEFVGRRDWQVKVRGYRVELGEVEALMRQQEGVREAVVAARPDARGEQRLVAYVVTAPPERPTLFEEIRITLRQQLPEYMLPAAFVRLDALPLNANGKVDRNALPEPESRGREVEAPATPTEREVAGIWAEVLEVNRVGREEDFFELGGHSLLAAQVTTRVRAAFGIELPAQDLFEHPTVADFGEHIDTIRWTAPGLQPSAVAAAGREEGEL